MLHNPIELRKTLKFRKKMLSNYKERIISKICNKNGISAYHLKIIAIFAMTLDHVGQILLFPPYATVLRSIGRIAFPIFCFLIAEGFIHTKNRIKYILRITITAVLAEPIIDRCFYGKYIYWESQSVMVLFSIALAVLMLEDVVKRKIESILYRYLFSSVFFGTGVILTFVLRTEYGVLGFLMIIASYFFRNDKPVLIASLLACNFLYLNPIQCFGCFSCIFIAIYNGKRGKKMGYWPYLYYPLHIALIYSLSIVVLSGGVEKKANDSNGSNIVDQQSGDNDYSSIYVDEEIIESIGIVPESLVENYSEIFLSASEMAVLYIDSDDVALSKGKKEIHIKANIEKLDSGTISIGILKNGKIVIDSKIRSQKVDLSMPVEDISDNTYIVIVNESKKEVTISDCSVSIEETR